MVLDEGALARRMNTTHEQVWPLINPSAASNFHADCFSDGLLPHIHPARRIAVQRGFDALVDELGAEIESGNVRKTEAKYNDKEKKVSDGDLALYVYTPKCEGTADWKEASLISRGLILDHKRREIRATPFFKFFNDSQDEPSLKMALESENPKVRVTEKMDGSLGIVFHHAGKWLVATKGSFHSIQAEWGTKYLNENFDVSKLDTGTTYLGELIYPENRIVIPYAEDRMGITWLAAYHSSGREYTLDRLEREVTAAALPRAPLLAGQLAFESAASLREKVDALPWTSEGFVLYVESVGLRAKLKGPAYLDVHKAQDGVNVGAIWTNLKSVLFDEPRPNGEDKMDLETLAKQEENLHEEFLLDYFTYKTQVLDSYAATLAWMEAMRWVLNHHPDFGGLPRKDLGRMASGLRNLGRAVDREPTPAAKRDLPAALARADAAGDEGYSAAAVLLATVEAWDELWAPERAAHQRYPASVHELVGNVGKLLPEDPNLFL